MKTIVAKLFILISLGLLMPNPYKPLDIDFLKDKTQKKEPSKKTPETPPKKQNPNAFESIIKGADKVEGLFTFYIHNDRNQVFMEVTPEQFNELYMVNITRETGDGAMRHGVSMQGEFPFYFKKIGNVIQFIEKNVKFRSEDNPETAKALKNQIPDSIIRSVKVVGEPDENGSILIDANKLFIFDIAGMSGQRIQFDKTNSFFKKIKSFDLNSELQLDLNYRTKGVYVYTLADSRNITYTYHYSLSALPESNYSPRVADDRVGHFLTLYQDYNDILTESPYVRYINRWDLQKKYPGKSLSEPIKPIVFWLENTIPKKFRDPITEGVLAWNEAFEAIGFKNAIVVKQMPDDADWDPADIRYSTIRWLIQPGVGIGVGPSRANPFTGEIYDADIRIGGDYFRFYFNEFEEFIDPIINMDFPEYIESLNNKEYNINNHNCEYAQNMINDMAFAWYSNFELLNIPHSNKEELMEKFIHDGIVDLLIHEVGHTLGLRHNFKASSIYNLEQISNPDFIGDNGPVGSVMDYNGVNIMDGGHNFFQTKPGPYDYWAIEYAYAERPLTSMLSEEEFVDNIASKSTNPLYVYCTDEDSYGTRSVDPYCSSGRDLTSKPIDFFHKQLFMVRDFWDHLLENFESQGERYPKIRSIFYNGIYEYYKATRSVSKFIGGIEHSRHHVGETDKTPMAVIPAEIQRKALLFLDKNIFSKDAFNFSSELLNKLAPDRDATMTRWGSSNLDLSIHKTILQIQKTALYKIFDPVILQRVQDNEMRFNIDVNKFTLSELFQTTSTITWRELENHINTNSFRRNLQKEHLEILIFIMLNKSNEFPNDAVAFARESLNKLITKLHFSINNDNLDEASYSHYLECINRIESAYQAKTILN